MTGREIVYAAAMHLGLADTLNEEVLSGKYYSQDNLLFFLKEAYALAYMKYKVKFSDKCIQESYGANWKSSTTASATSTGNTLVVDDSIFDLSALGTYVYNSDLGESRKITGYTSETTVVLDSDIDETWDGDVIYHMTGEILFTGDLEDLQEIKYIGVKFNESDTEFSTVTPKSIKQLSPTNYPTSDSQSQLSPVYIESPLWNVETESYIGGVKVLPIPTVPLENSFFLKYVPDPYQIGLDSEPIFPKLYHNFLSYGVAWKAGRGLGKTDDEIEIYKKDYYEGLDAMMDVQTQNAPLFYRADPIAYDRFNFKRRR